MLVQQSSKISLTDGVGVQSAGHLVGHEHVPTRLRVIDEEQALRGKGFGCLESGHVLNAVIVVRRIEINNLKDGNNRSELIFVAVVIATLQRNSDVVTLVLLLAEGEVLVSLGLGSFVIATAIGDSNRVQQRFLR